MSQSCATQELGWAALDACSIGGINIHDLGESAFDKAWKMPDSSSVQVSCIGSSIANWGKSIKDPFDIALAEVERAIPRMKRLVTKLVRFMSWRHTLEPIETGREVYRYPGEGAGRVPKCRGT